MSGFLNHRGLKTRSLDGRNCVLLEYLYYRTEDGRLLRTRTATDGISTPALIWCIIPPFGRIWWSGILHDGCYKDSIEEYDFTTLSWEPWHPTEADADELIFEAMKSQDARCVMRFIIYINLRWFGWRAFDEDRALASKRIIKVLENKQHLEKNPLEEHKNQPLSYDPSGTPAQHVAVPGVSTPLGSLVT